MRARLPSRRGAEEIPAVGYNYNAGVHVGSFRHHLNEIAKLLSEMVGRIVHTRIHTDHAELHHEDDKVVARVVVHWVDDGIGAIVKSDLSVAAKALFSRHLPDSVPVVYQTLDGR